MKYKILIISFLSFALFSLFCTDNSDITGTVSDINSGSIAGTIAYDSSTYNQLVNVLLYKNDSRSQAGDSLIKTTSTSNGSFLFDSLPQGTYSIQVIKDSILLGEEPAISLAEGEDKVIIINITIIINQTINITNIDNSKTVIINNIVVENGSSEKDTSGDYNIVFTEKDTQEIKIEVSIDGVLDTIDVLLINNGDGTFSIIEINDVIDVEIISEDNTLGLIAYYPFNSNANDESGNGNNGTVNGATLTEDRFGKDMSAYQFSGPHSKHISVPHSSDFVFDDDFTISFWIKHENKGYFLDKDAIGTHTNDWRFALNTDSTCYYATRSGTNYGKTIASGIDSAQWNHIVITRVKSTGVLQFYVNGVEGESFDQITNTYNTTADLLIGVSDEGTGGYGSFVGALDDIYFFSEAISKSTVDSLYKLDGWPLNDTNNAPEFSDTVMLNSAEVGELYIDTLKAMDSDGDSLEFSFIDSVSGMSLLGNAITWIPTNMDTGVQTIKALVSDGNGGTDTLNWSITVTIKDLSSQLVAYYPFNGNANDESGNGNNGTINGATLTTDRFGNTNEAYSFDGTDDYILTTFSPQIVSGDAYSISYWIKTSSNNKHIFGLEVSGAQQFGSLVENNKLRFIGKDDDANVGSITSSNIINDDTWKHIVIIRTENDSLKMYINGVLNVSVKDNSLTDINASNNRAMVIGANNNSSSGIGGFINGTLDDFYFYNYEISETTVDSLYNLSGGLINNIPVIDTTNLTDSIIAWTDFSDTIHAVDIDGDTLSFSLLSNPTGMTITDSIINWTPETKDTGSHTISIQASDGKNGYDTLTYILKVYPEIITITNPIQSTTWYSGAVGTIIEWNISSGSQIEFYIYKGSDSIDICQPLTTNDGSCGFQTQARWGTGNNYKVKAKDSNGNIGWSEEFSIIDTSNSIPVIDSTDLTDSLIAWSDFSDTIHAVDSDGDTLSFSFISNPIGMTITDSITSWSPETKDTGSHIVSVQVSDGQGGYDTLTYTIKVHPEIITITNPDQSTVWKSGAIGTLIEWNISSGSQIEFYIYKGSDSIDICQPLTTNDGSCGFQTQTSWGTGSNYKVKAKDSNGNIGWSEEFSIVDTSKGLICHYPFNGNANDESGNGNNGSVNGASLTTDRFGNANKAYSFDGTNNFIDIGDLNYNSLNEYSISVWIKVNSLSNSSQSIVNNYGTGGGQSNYVTLSIPRNDHPDFPNQILFSHHDQNPDAIQDTFSCPTTVTAGYWRHIVVTRGTNMKMYVDGLLVNTISNLVEEAITNSDNWKIGKLNDYYKQFFNGIIDDIHIYNYEIPSNTIDSLYRVDGWPIISNDLVAHYLFSGNVNDTSGNNKHCSLNGATLTSDRFGNPDCAYYFDGTDDFIEAPDSLIDFKTSSFLMWFKVEDISTYRPLLGLKSKMAGQGDHFQVAVYETGSTLDGLLRTRMYQGTYAGTSTRVDDGEWHMYTYTPNDEGGFSVYLDGEKQSDATFGSYNHTGELFFGKRSDNAYYFKGTLDDIRFYEGKLDSSQVNQLYNLTK